MSIFITVILIIMALSLRFIPLPYPFSKMKKFAVFGLFGLALYSVGNGAVTYNDAGYCVHVRTVFGSESSKCDLGWYFSGWGRSTEYPHFITITHTTDEDASGSSVHQPYDIRMADNWAGKVTQTTRFGIPKDEEQFLRMARDFRSPQRLITSTLRPAVTSSLDSTANLFTMEEYWAGGRRDDFKTEYRDAVTKGRALITRTEVLMSGPQIKLDVVPSDSNLAADTAKTGGANRFRVVTKKMLGSDGQPIRIPNGYTAYGITVSTAIIDSMEPHELFEQQIEKRKEAAARRSIAKEQRLEQEEQRLLAGATAERNIAERQGKAREDQIQQTTEAETAKKLALIEADKIRGTARIAKETAQLHFERAEIDAKSVKVAAEAEAFAKNAVLEADGALAQKLDTYERVQAVWANAFAQRAVPSTILGSSGGTGTDSDVSTLLKLLTVKTANDLQLDTSIKPQQ